ncbi:MAG: squalene--hopene cyclase [Candidatus Hydrogenedentes bacterium]|nr:squalene--hopene cyclase [Candidatus Hydrogenedentota bacterium]
MDALLKTLETARARLLDARNEAGCWDGELSSSALSTATALCALTLARRAGVPAGGGDIGALIGGARSWLERRQNADGGWGDTVDSPTNISTTTLCWAALGAAQHEDGVPSPAAHRAETWLVRETGELTADAIARTICARYGLDRTFSVPILTMCALSGRFGAGRAAWRGIPALPFELGAFPRRWFNRLGLPVVSYALPALIAVGQAQHRQRPSRNPVLRCLRALARKPTLRTLEAIQPASGGFLEAAPLTSFVAMSLIGAGEASHPVTARCLDFLADTVRPDGSWPIDTNLRTWVTTLAVKALARGGSPGEHLPGAERGRLLEWILARQGRVPHPYTLAAPGGWAWTDLSGGVPDADDTPGALLAVYGLAAAEGRLVDATILECAEAGIRWLMDLQNKDGGIPTFCRGWGKLPFDKSCPDLTAHSLRAWLAWRNLVSPALGVEVDTAAARAITFLLREQAEDGSWTPLWFGNQAAPGQTNPVYGTAVTLGVPELPGVAAFAGVRDAWTAARARAVNWLLVAQGPDGGWGGAPGVVPSIEETALAVDALARNLCYAGDVGRQREAMLQGCAWLEVATASGVQFPATPIGLYFAQLWYHEAMYPLVFTVSALAGAAACLAEDAPAP